MPRIAGFFGNPFLAQALPFNAAVRYGRGGTMSDLDTGLRVRVRSHDGLTVLGAVVALVAFGQPSVLSAQEYDPEFEASQPAIDARVWFDRGEDPLLDTGDRVRLYYRSAQDAYVAIFHIDTDGQTQLVFPTDPGQTHYVRGGRDYRVRFGRSQYWYVDDQPGMGYFFILASATPMDFSQIPYSRYDRDWDLTRIGSEVYSDPYLAMDDYVATLVPDWEYGDYGLDYAQYSVEGRHEFPRFMCYDCHAYRPFYSWNPYAYSCSTFRVVVWDDPFYYPQTRYGGDHVVMAGRRPGTRPRFEFKERGGDDHETSPLVQRREGPQRTAKRRSSNGGVVTSPGLSSPRRTGSEAGRATPQPGARLAPPRTSGRERTPTATRPSAATRPSTRFRDSGGSNGARNRGAARPRGTEPESRARSGAASRTPAVRGRPTSEGRSRPQLERRRPRASSTAAPVRGPRSRPTTGRRPTTRSDAQGRVETARPRAGSATARTPGTRVQVRGSTPSRGSGGAPAVRPRASGGSGSSATARPRASQPSARLAPSVAPRATVRPPPRGSRSSGAARVRPRRPPPSVTPSRGAPARSRPVVRRRGKPGGTQF